MAKAQRRPEPVAPARDSDRDTLSYIGDLAEELAELALRAKRGDVAAALLHAVQLTRSSQRH